MSGLSIVYKPPGPVAGAFYRDRSPVSAIMGPIGSGKTGASLMRMIPIARDQWHSPIDGRRRAKFAVIRDTYTQLEGTTIPSWHTWVPRTVGTWSTDPHPNHEILFDDGGGVIELRVEFIGLGEHRIEDVLRGWEGTGAYLNEMDRLARDVMTFIRGRVGRWPPRLHGGPKWYGVWGDFNAPDTDNWTYDAFVENRPDDFAFFVQPGGRDPGAENLANLPAGYYERQMSGQPEWYIRRMIDNRFGFSRDGKPVYPEYNDLVHCAPADLQPVAGLPLLIGVDAGGSPAATIWQHMPNGQWRGLDELVALEGTVMGPTRFGQELNRLLKERFAAWPLYARDGTPMIRGVGDPSAAYGGDKSGDDRAWLEIVSSVTKIRIRPARTNKPSVRQDAVRRPLTQFIDGAPALLISPRMRFVRRGFNSHYRFMRVKTSEGRYHDEPEKNQWSHPHDAVQYVLLEEGGELDVLGRARASAGPRQVGAITEDSPRGVWDGRPGQQGFAITE